MFTPYVKRIDDRKVMIVNSDTDAYTLVNTHSQRQCGGECCVLHNPSEHHMRQMPLNFRADSGLFERICSHGIGHPDPDSLAYFTHMGADYMAVHGCDGCCAK